MAASVRVNGTLIRHLRECCGLERKELAEAAGITANRMYVIEVYKQTTRPSTLRRIAGALGVEPDALANGGGHLVGASETRHQM